ncbi:MAG: glycosyltransferase family 4 protein [Candidatus Gastranaerophilaceae bacterium]
MIINSFYAPDIRGGAEYSIKKLAEGLVAKGHSVRILCTGNNNVHEIIDGVDIVRLRTAGIHDNGDIHAVPRWKRLLGHLIDIWNIGNLKILTHAIEEFKPDVINTNNLYGISPIVWKIAKKKGIRLVHTIRDYYLMCPLVAMSCKKTGGEKCKKPMLSCLFHRTSNRIHSKYVDCVTAPSSLTLNVLIENGFFKNSTKVVIPNAIDYDKNTVEAILRNKKNNLNSRDKVRFVYLGTLSEQKGIRWLIDSFNDLKAGAAVLFIAGKGDLQDYVEQESQKNQSIKYMGFLSEPEVSKLLTESDVLICPSLWEEPFGRVVLDAYKHVMPVISSNMGALPELVKDEKTGFVVEAKNRQKLTEKINVYINSPEIILEQAKCCINELSRYTIESQLTEFENHYI